MQYHTFEYEWERPPLSPYYATGDVIPLSVTCRVNQDIIEILQVFVEDGTEMRHIPDALLVDLMLYAQDFVI